ncbi:MAG: hypothetical protein JWO60_2936 [Frankiales bacterium]|nr:hypothetical protein [Frankiales bacterium]
MQHPTQEDHVSGLDTSQAVTDEVSLNSEKYHAHSLPVDEQPVPDEVLSEADTDD